MSDSFEKIIDKLPDVYFDWYARLLPGCFGVGLYIYLADKIPKDISANYIVLFLFFGYILGHILQPLSGVLIKCLENYIGHKDSSETKYATYKRKENPDSSLIHKVSKAHAEANSMLSFAFALLLNFIIFLDSPKLNRWFVVGVIVYFVAMAVERGHARKRKIDDLP